MKKIDLFSCFTGWKWLAIGSLRSLTQLCTVSFQFSIETRKRGLLPVIVHTWKHGNEGRKIGSAILTATICMAYKYPRTFFLGDLWPYSDTDIRWLWHTSCNTTIYPLHQGRPRPFWPTDPATSQGVNYTRLIKLTLPIAIMISWSLSIPKYETKTGSHCN